MSELIQSFADYLHHTLGVKVKPEKWEGCRALPVFMQSMYDCYTARILGERCLLLVSRAEEQTTPAAVRKHFDIAHGKWPGTIALVRRSMRSNDRRRLVADYKLPFVVPGNQMYLPDFGLDLREHFRSVRKEEKPFSPSTQVLVLRTLLSGNRGPLSAAQFARSLPYTSMTIKRAFDEIELAGLGAARMRGRERELHLEAAGRQLWEAALPFLRSPVMKRVTVASPPGVLQGLEAGLAALSRYSMISAPVQPSLAVSAETWKTARAIPDVCETDTGDEDARQVEIWRYDPVLLSDGAMVDRLSLFLSLRDTNDERIEAALDEMMEDFQW